MRSLPHKCLRSCSSGSLQRLTCQQGWVHYIDPEGNQHKDQKVFSGFGNSSALECKPDPCWIMTMKSLEGRKSSWCPGDHRVRPNLTEHCILFRNHAALAEYTVFCSLTPSTTVWLKYNDCGQTRGLFSVVAPGLWNLGSSGPLLAGRPEGMLNWDWFFKKCN